MGPTVAVFCLATILQLRTVSSDFSPSCQYQLFRPSSQNDGYLMSPNYPELYSPGSCLTWIYYGKPGMQISIRLLDIDIPTYSAVCRNDFLMIGPNNEQTYCGSSDSKDFELYQAQLTRWQYWLYVAFNSTNDGTKGRGFKLYYHFSNPLDTSSVNTTVKISSTASSTVQRWNEMFDDHAASCQFNFTSETGLISTNSKVLNCLERTRRATWLIFSPGPAATNVNYELHFEQCYLPYPDSLKIYDGYSNIDIAVSYSNSICSSSLVSSNHGFFIEYLRQAGEAFPSFVMQFVIVDSSPTVVTEIPKYTLTAGENRVHQSSDKCIFQLSGESGEINSNNLFSSLRNTGYCSWLLYMPGTDGHQVIYTLNFVIFKLSQNSIFKVYDGANMSASTLGTFSMLMPPFILTSSQNRVFMHYIPGSNFETSLVDFFTVKYSTYVRCALGHEPCGYGEFSCFQEENRCDGVWHCPLHGGDERGCTTHCPTNFSCDFTTPNCYTENDRCNGKGTCSNYMDEMGCDEDRCSSNKGLYLCKNGRCIYEKWRCDRMNDCFDNSDEEDCSTYEDRCSSNKGLYLCKNGRCIYEKLRCDRMNDCFDNSDEEDCSTSSSPRLIIAAVVGSLLCALLLVIAVGCVCKVYHIQARQFRGGPYHETPLSRQLAEMFYRRAPPPPYHEAMLTSRPYDQAHPELGQTEHHLEASGVSSSHSANLLLPPRERIQRNSRSRRNQHTDINQNVRRLRHPVNVLQYATRRVVQVEAELLRIEDFEDDVPRQEASPTAPANSSEPSDYSDYDLSNISRLFCNNSEDESIENGTSCGGVDNTGYNGDNDSHASADSETVMHLELIPSIIKRRSFDHSAASTSLYLGNSSETRADPARSFSNVDREDNGNKDIDDASTSLSAGSSIKTFEEDIIKFMPAVSIIDDDSDSDCILDGNNLRETNNYNDNNKDDDAPCILEPA